MYFTVLIIISFMNIINISLSNVELFYLGCSHSSKCQVNINISMYIML